MPKFNLFALTNPTDGRDEEFNDWYTNVHLTDVLKLPGVVDVRSIVTLSAQKSTLAVPLTARQFR